MSMFLRLDIYLKMLSKTALSLLKNFHRNLALKKGKDRSELLSKSIVTTFNKRKELKSSEILKMRDEFLNSEKEKYQNTFGDIENFELKFLKAVEDPKDVEKYLKAKAAQGKSIRQYIAEVKMHLTNHDYEKAVSVLEVDMVNDKKPTVSHIYDMLIAYNAKQGNLKEAYRLFIMYKKRQGLVSGGMYTSMFEACTNCKNSFYALEKAAAVRESLIKDKRHKVNAANYNAMLKAYAWHGDMATCLELFDEILERQDKVRSITYSFLFHACISDKNSGLRFALLLWRKMIQNKVKPDIYTFNLLLQCVKECSFGQVELIDNLVEQIKRESNNFYKRKVVTRTLSDGTKDRKVFKIPSGNGGLISNKDNSNENSDGKIHLSEKEVEDELKALDSSEEVLGDSETSTHLTVTPFLTDFSSDEAEDVTQSSLERNTNSVYDVDSLPNLIAMKPTVGSVLNFKAMTEPHQRFMCLGGLKGFLKVMSEFGVKPDIKTITCILSVVEPNRETEELLIAEARKYNIKLDTTFFNVLIKKRNTRLDFDSIEDALSKMQQEGVTPNIMTFGVLAMGCRTCEEGVRLLKTIHEFGFRTNKEILGALLHNASRSMDMKYVKEILNAAKKDEMEICPKFFSQLETIVKKEKKRRKNSTEIDISRNIKNNSEKVEEISST